MGEHPEPAFRLGTSAQFPFRPTAQMPACPEQCQQRLEARSGITHHMGADGTEDGDGGIIGGKGGHNHSLAHCREPGGSLLFSI
jgi:hypothetical protein